MKRNPNFFRQESPIIKLFSEKFGFYISLDLWENLNFWIFPQCALAFPALDVQTGRLCGSLCFLFFPVVCFPPCGKIILIAFHRFGVSSGGFLIHFLPGFLGGFGSIRPLFRKLCRRCRVGFGLPYQLFPCYLFPALVGFQTFRFLRR